MISLPNGTLKPLSEFATVNVVKGSAEVNGKIFRPLENVTARLDNGNLGGTIQEIQNRFLKK
jgi:Cu/Ag efflux pump CusA